MNLMLCYLHEDMHALLVYIYKPVKGGLGILDGNLRVLSYMVVAPWIALYAFACIMPACMHTPPATSLTEMHYGIHVEKLDV